MEESINDIINELAIHLNDPDRMFDKQNIARYEDEPFFGWELKLCNIKEVKGKPIVEHEIYYMPVPVLRKVDHRAKMRQTYFSGGRAAVIRYIEKWVKPDQLEVCRAIIFGKFGEYQTQRFRDAGIDEDLIEKVNAERV